MKLFNKIKLAILQWLILPLINNNISRKFLGVPNGKRIVKVTANSIHWKDKEKFKAKIYNAKTVSNKGKKVITSGVNVALMLLALGIDKSLVFPLIALTTTSFYSGAGDGRVANEDPADNLWSSCRNGTSGTISAAYTGTQSNHGMSQIYVGNYRIYRAFFPIDTSSLGSGATISSAIFYHYITIITDDDGSSGSVLVQTTQSSTSSLSDGDYTAVGSVSGGSLLYSNYVVNSYNGITLNETGIGWINKTGYTKIGIREKHDFDDTAPTVGTNRVYGRFSEYADTTYDPYLEVTYTVATGTNMSINIGDSWKEISAIKINIGDVWKTVTSIKQNIGDVWKDVF